jgi:hypothetical protein
MRAGSRTPRAKSYILSTHLCSQVEHLQPIPSPPDPKHILLHIIEFPIVGPELSALPKETVWNRLNPSKGAIILDWKGPLEKREKVNLTLR